MSKMIQFPTPARKLLQDFATKMGSESLIMGWACVVVVTLCVAIAAHSLSGWPMASWVVGCLLGGTMFVAGEHSLRLRIVGVVMFVGGLGSFILGLTL